MCLKFVLISCFLLITIVHCDSVTFKCEENAENSTDFICVTKNLIIQTEFTKIEPQNVINADKIQTFWIKNSQTFYMPHEINKIFPKLKVLKITNSKLRRISSKDFKNMPDLRELDLSGNDINILDEKLFSHNENLSTIILRNNKISRIHESSFKNLKHLTTLDISGNSCIDGEAMDMESVKFLILQATALCAPSIEDFKVKVLQVEDEFQRKFEEVPKEMEKLRKELNVSKDIQNIKELLLIYGYKIEKFQEVNNTQMQMLQELLNNQMSIKIPENNQVFAEIQKNVAIFNTILLLIICFLIFVLLCTKNNEKRGKSKSSKSSKSKNKRSSCKNVFQMELESNAPNVFNGTYATPRTDDLYCELNDLKIDDDDIDAITYDDGYI